jgi:hypothetical protein
MERWQQFLLALLATGGFVKLIELIYKFFEFVNARYAQKGKDDTSLILRDKDELANFREWLANEVERLSVVAEKFKEEKHQLEMKLALQERDIKDDRRLISEQDEELILVRAECHRLTTENNHLKHLQTIHGVNEQE